METQSGHQTRHEERDLSTTRLSTITLPRVWLLLVLAALSVAAIVNQSVVLVLVAMTLLATVAAAPQLNPLMYWPLGLLAMIVVGYGTYFLYWSRSVPGVSHSFSEMHFFSLVAFFLAVGLVRIARNKSFPVTPAWPWSRVIVAGIVVAAPIAILYIGSSRLNNDSLSMFSGYMSGGDHGLHNEIIHDLLSWSATPSNENPFSLYTYPRGVHYLIAQFVALGSVESTKGALVQEYLTGAWFEYVQLAAVVQLSVVIFVKWSRKHQLERALFVAPLILVFASMDHFVAHLFWSGFMTSTAMTWALLIPIAVWVGTRNGEGGSRLLSTGVILWFLLVGFAWIAYQPYVMPVVAGGSVALVLWGFERIGCFTRFAGFAGRPTVALGLGGGVSLMAVVASYFVLGSESPAITSLFLDGSTWRPAIGSVVAWVTAAVVLMVLGHSQNGLRGHFPAIVVSSLGGFTIGMAGIVFFSGDDGLFDMPYYIQKMFWIMLYLSIPIALGAGSMLVLRTRLFRDTSARGTRLVGLWLAVALIPLAQGRLPNAAVTHFSVDWFARGVFSVEPRDTENNGAFSMRDKLGSHMANLALRSASTTVLSPDVAISGNPYLACRDIRDQGMTRVYTTPNGRAEMFESGCPTDIEYVEDGVSLEPVVLDYFEIDSVTERFNNTSLGFRLLLRGFLPPEKWGTWAGGYRSALGFRYLESMEKPQAEISLRRDPSSWNGQRVVVHANGEVMATLDFAASRRKTFTVPLPVGARGTAIELTLTCERTTQQILDDDPADGPGQCVGLETLRVFDAG